MTVPSLVVSDTNVLRDMTKPGSASDVSRTELVGAHAMLRMILEHGQLKLAYSKGMLPEWKRQGLFKEDAVLRILLDSNKLECVRPRLISGGQRADLARYVNRDDQVFVLTAAELNERRKTLVTRDPKTTQSSSRAYTRRVLRVIVCLSSEFVADWKSRKSPHTGNSRPCQ